MKKKIIVCGANPAWQKTLFFNELIPGKVNRAEKEENYPSGKGVNFCRALRCSGLAEMCLIQFAGGGNGERLCSGLDAAGFPHETVVTAAETRSCITCLDKQGFMTELIGVSARILPDEEKEFFVKLDHLLKSASLFAITGSLPDGSNPEIYVKAAAMSSHRGIPILIDALIGADEILRLPGIAILKVNQEEFFKITGANEIISAHRNAAACYPDKIFAITNGSDNATLSCDGCLWEYQLPQLDVINPLGAGDTASAVMAGLYASGCDANMAFRQALAAASANCLTPMAGEFSVDCAKSIAEKINVLKHNLW